MAGTADTFYAISSVSLVGGTRRGKLLEKGLAEASLVRV